MKKTPLILIFILFQYPVFSQDFGKVHNLISEGISSIYQIDFPAALVKFQEAKNTAPGDLRGPFFESTVYFWKTIFSRSRPDYETYLNLSDKLLERCTDAVDKNENDLDAQFYMGWSYTMRAFIVYMMDRNMLKAASDVKDGNKALLYVVEKNPQYYDAYLGLGVYNYMASLIPRKFQWLTSILGFSGDREEGKKQLKMAAEKGTYTNTEAKFYLTMMAWREENYTLAEDYATQLRNTYPESPASWMLWGLLLSQQDKMDEAIRAYEKSIEFNKGKESDIVYKTAYGSLSSAYFRTNRFEMATEYGKKYMSYSTKDDRINNRLYSLGVSLELTGRRSEAVSYYRLGRTDFMEDNEWEKYWLRKLKQRENSPLTTVDSLLISADNNRAVSNFEGALNDYNRLNSSFDQVFTNDIQVQINHGLGQLYFKQKNYEKAIEFFKLNMKLNPEEEKWLVPEAYFQVGRCLLRLGRKQEAMENFEKAEDIDYDYDFKKSLDMKIQNEVTKFE